MRYFLDTEFVEQPNTIELISIGLVAEDGRELYMVHSEANLENASEWVKKNVLTGMPQYNESYNDLRGLRDEAYVELTIADIREKILFFCGQKNNVAEKCSFYGYYSAYDWVIFCWIFGKMIDLPDKFPMFCIDLKQMMEERLLNSEWKERNVPNDAGEHHALADARWNLKLYKEIREHDNAVARDHGFYTGPVEEK